MRSGLVLGTARAAACGGLGGLLVGGLYAAVVGCLVMAVSLVMDSDGPSGGVAELVASVLTLLLYAGVVAALVGAGLGAVSGAVLAVVLRIALRPLVSALQRRGLGRVREPYVAAAVAVVGGLALLPDRVVVNTTLLLDGTADDALQLVVGKVCPTLIMAVGAARLWHHLEPAPSSRS